MAWSNVLCDCSSVMISSWRNSRVSSLEVISAVLAMAVTGSGLSSLTSLYFNSPLSQYSIITLPHDLPPTGIVLLAIGHLAIMPDQL
jgi:hypothetical protein